jgi:hypothetical protein
MSTREKRQRRAVSSPAEVNLLRYTVAFGCGLVLVVYLGACLLLSSFSVPLAIVIALGLPAVVVAAAWLTQYLYGLGLLLAVRRWWTPKGVRCLLIYSKSPNWEAHVREQWLPRLGDVAVTLNWSERASWTPNLAVRIFRHFCGRRDFNPAVVVFQGLDHPLVFRFFPAFKQAKAGRPGHLERLEAELFALLDYESGGLRPGRLPR